MAHYPYPQHRIRPFLLRKEKSRNRHIFLTLHSIIYGFSRFANGILVDRFSKKKIMSIGLVLTCIVNLIICVSPKLLGLLSILDTEGNA